MNIILANSKSDSVAWDAFVQSSPIASGYQQYAWREIFSRSYHHASHYLAAVTDDGTWRGILPLVHLKSALFGNELVSLPFVNYGGLACDDEHSAAKLLEAADRLKVSTGASRIELRHQQKLCSELPARQHKVTMILDLAENETAQWDAFNPKLRNQIRKAEKGKLIGVEGQINLLAPFYDVMARNMRDLGSPIHSKLFFQNVLEGLPDSTRILAVYLGDEMIAAGLVCWFKDTMEIPWASSIRDYNSLCPNNLLYWSAIRFAISRGFKRFDFGRSTLNEGTFNFKKQWGALPLQLNWQYLPRGYEIPPEQGTSSRKFQAVIKAWQQLPVGVTKIIGPAIRKGISL